MCSRIKNVAGAFSGRDASVPFVSGAFTAEEAEKGTDTLSIKDLPGLTQWYEFYKTHAVYKFVGHLVDPRYYDENGNPTPDMEVLQQRLETLELQMSQTKVKKAADIKPRQ
jgi:hypothetical protein